MVSDATCELTGLALFSLDLNRDYACAVASVKKNVAPLSTSDSAQIRPPCLSMIRRTIANPAPVPG